MKLQGDIQRLSLQAILTNEDSPVPAEVMDRLIPRTVIPMTLLRLTGRYPCGFRRHDIVVKDALDLL